MEVPEIDVEALAERRAEGAPLFDVREPDEYDEAHVPGAVLVPLASLLQRTLQAHRPWRVGERELPHADAGRAGIRGEEIGL